MNRIDDKMVLLGGLVAAGALLAGSATIGRLLGSEVVVAIFQAPGVEQLDGMRLVGYVQAHVLLGFATVWLHAALRPQFGPGGSAVRAGLAVWLVAMPVPMLFQLVLGLERPSVLGGMMMIVLIVSAGLYSVAAGAGAWACGAFLQKHAHSAGAATENP